MELDPAILERHDVRKFQVGVGVSDASMDEAGPGLGGGVIRLGTPEEQSRIKRANRGDLRKARYPQLVDLINRTVPGRTSDEEITYLRNEGTQGLQFAAVAYRVYQLAKSKGLGRELPTDWFTESIRN
jgi:ornithine cyclodeaminase/alanine dehydrogenase-like protein (mu-crystallin family)